MYPSLFQIGNISFSSYSLLLIISFIIAILGAIHLAKYEGIKTNDIINLCTLCFIFGLIFARILSIIIHYEHFVDKPKIFTTGLSSHGGLIGCILAIIFYAIRDKTSFWKLIDLVIPFGALAYALGRIGCYLAGCCRGIETSVLWSVTFPGKITSVHPVQLYDSYLNFLLFLFLLEHGHYKKFDGQLFLLFLLGNSIIRFFVEYFRWGVSAKIVYDVITQAQIASIFTIIASLMFIKILSNKDKTLKVEG